MRPARPVVIATVLALGCSDVPADGAPSPTAGTIGLPIVNGTPLGSDEAFRRGILLLSSYYARKIDPEQVPEGCGPRTDQAA